MSLQKKRVVIYYSSTTGNTRKLAEYIAKLLGERQEVLLGRTAETELPAEADLIILAFWCRKSGLDDISRTFLERLSGRNILGMGTMAGDAYGEYGKRVAQNVREAIEKQNTCIGVILCQGAANMSSIKKRMALPEDNPHHVSEEKYKRLLLTQGRPDEVDLEKAGAELLKMIEEWNNQLELG